MMTKKKKKGFLVFEFIFLLLNVFIIVVFYKNILLTTISLLIVAIIGLTTWKSKRTLMIFIFAGIGGTLVEMIAIHFGVWKYTITNFFNVPFWLFIIWGNAAALIYQVAKKIKEERMEIK